MLGASENALDRQGLWANPSFLRRFQRRGRTGLVIAVAALSAGCLDRCLSGSVASASLMASCSSNGLEPAESSASDASLAPVAGRRPSAGSMTMSSSDAAALLLLDRLKFNA